MPQLFNLTGRRFLVWGLGKTGIATAGFLSRQGAHVTVVDSASASKHTQTLQTLAGLSIEYFWERTEPTSFSPYECILLSPGVPYDLPGLQRAREQGCPTLASLQWAAEHLDQPMVAVTGSAGKSTTVSLLGEMLRASGLSSFVGGNLGYPLISLLEQEDPVERIVVECSSFQLEACPHFTPQVSILTNLSSNHLDRHKTMERYAECKAQQFKNLSPDAWVIVRADDPESLHVVQQTSATILYISTHRDVEQGATLREDTMILKHPMWGEEEYSLSSYALPGVHNRENAMAAALATRLLGGTPQGIEQGLQHFRSLAHRLEDVSYVEGVRYINDSKSTTPESCAKAISAFRETGEPLHILLGGKSKGSCFRELALILAKEAQAVYLFGEAAEEIAQALQGHVDPTLDPTMERALERAQKAAQAGDIVLLSPACASYDQFSNFEERGDAFKAWVHAIAQSATHEVG